jgi:superfamily II DNA or RNA helicase
MQEPHTALLAGQHVVVRDEHWTVINTDIYDAAVGVQLRGAGAHNRDQLQYVLTPFDRVELASAGSRVRQRSRRAVLATVARALADSPTWNQCWTAGHASIDLRAWQLAPALAAVRGATRILLADGVGLGKTIQAGLVVTELIARGLADRVLVLTPAAIRGQWAGELRSRFALTPVVLDQPALATVCATLPQGVNPWATAPLIISSIDLVKRPEIRAAIESVPFDIIVVDEAHHLTPGTDRGAVIADLAQRTPWVVLATATPHSGDEQAFAFLTRLGDTGRETLTIFRRVTVARNTSQRRSRLLVVTPTPAERLLLDATRQYARALSAKRDGGASRLLASVISRRAASSAAAVSSTLSRRLALLSGHSAEERQPLLPWEEVDGVDDDVADRVLSCEGLGDPAAEIEWLRTLIGLANVASPVSSKLNVVGRLLRRTREQLLLFSEYRDVALLAAAALADVTTVAALHGGLSPTARAEAVRAFNAGAVRTLVATDAAGEGLNLQARCRLVVNIELPWTPLRLEQRIGRVDRIGQTRRVHALHLVHRDSYESTVVARLERRRARVRAADRGTDAEEHVTPAAAERRLRVLAGHDGSHFEGGPVYARGPRSRYLVLVFEISLVDAQGRFVQREIVGLRLERAHARPLARSDVRALDRDPRVRDAINAEVQSRMDRVHAITSQAAGRLEARLSALIAHAHEGSATASWQGSLFERRREQQAHRHAHAVLTHTAHLRRRQDAARALGQLVAGTPRLIAAWTEVR